jgi:hypothetical protein
MHGEVGNTVYRVYLRSEERIVCRHEFPARNDAEACRLAGMLADATADLCDAFEIWQGPRVVACPEIARRDPPSPAPSDGEMAFRALGEAIRKSHWPVAESPRLASRLVAAQRPDASLLERLLRDAVAATGADRGTLQLLEGDGALRIAAQHGFERDFLDFFAFVRDVDSSCGQALKAMRRVIVEDVLNSPIFQGKLSGAVLSRAGLRSTFSTPIHVAGRLCGMISTHRLIPWRPDADERALIDRFADDAAAIIV